MVRCSVDHWVGVLIGWLITQVAGWLITHVAGWLITGLVN